jgi:hypothetical protein
MSTAANPSITLKVPEEGNFELLDFSNSVYALEGERIGWASSERQTHSPHAEEFAAKGEKCSACRWFEVAIYLPDKTEDYILHTIGRTRVPSENDWGRVRETVSAYELIELLTVRPRPRAGFEDVEGRKFLPEASARVLAQAAEFDEGIKEAYVARKVF